MAYFRLFRRVHLAPGVTLNIAKTGPSLSFGVRGAHLTIAPERDPPHRADCAKVLQVPAETIEKEIRRTERMSFAEYSRKAGESLKPVLLEKIREAARKGDPGARAWLRSHNLLKDDA